MRRVWKIDVAVDDQVHTHKLPKLSTVLHTACQHGNALPGLPSGIVQVWFEVFDDEPLEERSFVVHGTGHPIEQGHYVGTGFDAGGALVWHVYEVPTPVSVGERDEA